mmetsp:Transcript_30731/g.47529  ORF Transcript_30731/g.47529 Transcript_30731/m.47529 type:complete len:272 (-) Transcript_30731:50-865(-)
MNLSRPSTTSPYWTMVSEATERPPTTTSTGYLRDLRARFSTVRGKVAEKRTVWRSGRTESRMASIWGANPMSNMRSASSMTTKETLCRESIFPDCMVSMSIILPGVTTATCVPLRRSPICSDTLAPPYTAVDRRPRCLQKLRHTACICAASSLAGASTSPMGPDSPSPRGGWSIMCRSMGRRKARVLPDPVLAMPMTSRPAMIAGRHCAWMGKGSRIFCFFSTERIRSERPHSRKEGTGAGQPTPRTRTAILARRTRTSSLVRPARARGTT